MRIHHYTGGRGVAWFPLLQCDLFLVAFVTTDIQYTRTCEYSARISAKNLQFTSTEHWWWSLCPWPNNSNWRQYFCFPASILRRFSRLADKASVIRAGATPRRERSALWVASSGWRARNSGPRVQSYQCHGSSVGPIPQSPEHRWLENLRQGAQLQQPEESTLSCAGARSSLNQQIRSLPRWVEPWRRNFGSWKKLFLACWRPTRRWRWWFFFLNGHKYLKFLWT